MGEKPSPSPQADHPIGIFDSGVGGLTVLRHLVDLLPDESMIYVADQANVPYGEKSAATIHALSRTITQFLLNKQCKLIVVACNTATAAAISQLRAEFHDTLLVGMEPAIKPGAAATRTGKIGVLATAGTFESQRYASLMARYAADIEIMENRCVGLVDLIERGEVESAETITLLEEIITPMLNQGVDTLVLGCTHYPFVEAAIAQIAGDGVTIIDPAPAVARHVARILADNRLLRHQSHNDNEIDDTQHNLTLLTTGDANQFAQQVSQLLGWYVTEPATPLTVPIDQR